MTSSSTTLSAVRPNATACGPHALLPIIPPSVARSCVEGSGPNRSPCGAAARCRSDMMTPGSTTGRARVGVDREHAVDVPREVEHHAGADCIARDRCASAACGDRSPAFPRGGEGAKDVIDIGREDHHLGYHPIVGRIRGVLSATTRRAVDRPHDHRPQSRLELPVLSELGCRSPVKITMPSCRERSCTGRAAVRWPLRKPLGLGRRGRRC